MTRLDPQPTLGTLKEFQRRTVDYVIHRMYEDPSPTKRFLVADEVGLGKTMVARGVIARVIERLWKKVPRIDVIYVCSNTAIAQQNLKRLNVFGKGATSLPTRLTLLPLHLAGPNGLKHNKVNFVSLTPGTAFNLRSSEGIALERALIFRLLKQLISPIQGFSSLLRVQATKSWNGCLDRVHTEKVDCDLAGRFRAAVQDQQSLVRELEELSGLFEANDDRWNHTQEIRFRQLRAISSLRGHLASACVAALEPDLIILDEFQRFPTLLEGEHDAAVLARQLFECVDADGNEARTLLLSATPYRALSLSSDSKDSGNHYREFLKTVGFLYGDGQVQDIVKELKTELRQFRREMFSLTDDTQRPRELKASIEEKLKNVIARTERVRVERNAMTEEPDLGADVKTSDLLQALTVHKLAHAVGTHSIVEYWKSGPYLLNFMRGKELGALHGYQLKRELKQERHATNPVVLRLIGKARKHCLDFGKIRRYMPIEPANGRMRALIKGMLDDHGLDRHLWIPPAVPYYGDREKLGKGPSKALVFSSWGFVPDAIAAVLSYEVERRMHRKGERGRSYFDTTAPRPLHFRDSLDRPQSLRDLNLVYPSPEIARTADPLDVVASHSELLTYKRMRAELMKRLRPLVGKLQEAQDPTPGPDTWEWAGPAVLDALSEFGSVGWLREQAKSSDLTNEKAFSSHIDYLLAATDARQVRGFDRKECLERLVDLALGSPAICALRALRRVAPCLSWDNHNLLTAAAKIAMAFRALYNQRESVAMLRKGRRDAYWHSVISFGARNNLQSMLDEYVHFVVEALDTQDKEPEERVRELSAEICNAVSLRPSVIEMEDPQVQNGRLEFEPRRMRGRFAMRFAQYREEDGSVKRVGRIRAAFNSPFRPFVLASTSIGQEGLDFHPYCRFLYHWNLPHNPVDLEQREGRVHRYKCHAVRLNVAQKHESAVRGVGTAPSDPWKAMFDDASTAAVKASSDYGGLVPFWMYDGPYRIERRVPVLPYSKEVSQLRSLSRSLAVYRLAFGQPRQDDFLEYLEQLDNEESSEDLAELQISLEPPIVDSSPSCNAGTPEPADRHREDQSRDRSSSAATRTGS